MKPEAQHSGALGAFNRDIVAKARTMKNAINTPSATAPTASDNARVLSVNAKVASATLNSRDFVALTKALVTQFGCAHAEKGDRRARAIDACRVFGASLLTETLASENPSSLRVSVNTVTKERGHEVSAPMSVGVVLVLKCIVFGGKLIGATSLAR